jgi:sterol desaturase/sphingolipid hydroxylase (fatty acid hydroxylase superfamily)
MFRTFASYTLWPALVVGQIVVLYVLLQAHPAQTPIAMGGTSLVSFLILAGMEMWIPFRADWRLRGDQEIGGDVVHLLVASQIGYGLGEWLIPIVGVVTIGQVCVTPLAPVWPTGCPYWLQIALLVFCADGLEYWLHRVTHTVPWLWPLHIVHHMPERLHVIKSGRHHFTYFVLRHLVVFAPFLFLGAPASVVLWYPICIFVTGFPAHANVALQLPRFLHPLVTTPEVHRLHHSIDVQQGNSNYAVIFPIWDILFGTFCDPATAKLDDVGLGWNPVPKRIVAELAAPFLWLQFVSRARPEEVKA